MQIRDIQNYILEYGKASFSTLEEIFEVNEDYLYQIEKELKNNSIIRKNKNYHTPFFETKKRLIRKTSDEKSLTLLSHDWEKKSSQRLCELLKEQDLKNLLKGETRYAFLQLRESIVKNTSNYLSKQELADIIILEHGIDLFSNKEIRQIIAKKCSIKDIPQKWNTGKFRAIQFVSKTGFPKELEGVSDKWEKLPNFEALDAKKFYKLVDFQEEIKNQMLEKLTHLNNKFIVSLPTGAGKTKTAVHSILEHIKTIEDTNPRKHILWLAHTEELCEQAYTCFKETARNIERDYSLFLFRYWGNYVNEDLSEIYSTEKDPCIIISTPQKIRNILNSEEEEKKLGTLDLFKKNLFLLFIDEAHRAGSNTYKSIIEKSSKDNKFLTIAGLTATPIRMEYNKKSPNAGTEELKEIFKDLILPINTLGNNLIHIKKELEKQEYLSKLKRIPIDTEMHIKLTNKQKIISDMDAEQTQIIDKTIQHKADSTKRRLIILSHIEEELKKYPEGKFLYFGATVRDAKLMSTLLRAKGHTAEYVVGDTKKSTRRKIIKEFKKGKVQFLCNCEILTTGFDEPQITHLIMARPTISQVLYQQMIGRGLRGKKFGGTEKCRVLSCEDLDINYEQFYNIWRKNDDTTVWNFEKLFIKSLILTIKIDYHIYEEEINLFKKIVEEDLGRNISEEEIMEEMNSILPDVYFDNLSGLKNTLKEDQKNLLLKRCVEISKIDGIVDEKEDIFLKKICNVLDIHTNELYKLLGS